jgi:glycosyltransferase involved in cell wall biosynthesis
VAVSDAVAAGMRGYDARLRVSTIADCVPCLEADANATARLRAELGGDLVIGHVGSLDDSIKGQSALIEAVRILGPRARDMRFLLIGDGKDEAALRARAADLPNVRFIGWVDNIADYYAMMDIFVFPSRYEALGSSLLEAMSFGVPVVATIAGGIPEIVRDGTEGFLVAMDDARAIADRILRLADDAALRRRLGAQAHARAQAYSAQGMMLRYLELYRTIGTVDRSGERR